MKKEMIIISLGGSLVVPDEVDVDFLKKFRKIILNQITKGKRFVLIIGGGKICRKYQKAASEIVGLTSKELDWLGISATRFNAYLVKTIFKNLTYREIIADPTKKIRMKNEKVIVAAGWKPGCSTDYDAVLLAKNLGVKTLINLTNIDYVYDKDPKKYPDAKIIKNISWQDFRKIVGNKWDPGLNMPFDPVASKAAQKQKMKVIIANGKNLKNLEKILSNKGFVGTVIN